MSANTNRPMRHVCFTLYADEMPPMPEYVRYCVYQRECCPETQREHFQCYAEFSKLVKLGGLKKWLPNAHFEERRGTREQARDYCMKRESRVAEPVEYGSWESGGQGTRNDLKEACEMLKQGSSMSEVARQHPTVVAKFGKGLQHVQSLIEEKPRDVDFEPRPWQKLFLEEWLPSVAGDRKILWIYDTEGNVGKSRLATYLRREHGAAQLNGRVCDMVSMYRRESIVIFDVPRSRGEDLKHLFQFAEQLKNGYLMNTKYECRTMEFDPPKVVFMANFACPSDVFSADRVVQKDIQAEIRKLSGEPSPQRHCRIRGADRLVGSLHYDDEGAGRWSPDRADVDVANAFM